MVIIELSSENCKHEDTAQPPPPAEATVHVTMFANEAAITLTEKSYTPIELRDLISSTTAASKEQLPWLKLAVFGRQRSDVGCLRNNNNVQQISGIETDYDESKIPFDEAVGVIRKHKLRALLYTSPSHTTEAPRWRILLPTSMTLPPGERARLVARVNGLFDGVLSGESFTLSQSYYFGSVKNNPAHRTEIVDGGFIDARMDLDAGAIFKKNRSTVRRPLTDVAGVKPAAPITSLEDERLEEPPADVKHMIATAAPPLSKSHLKGGLGHFRVVHALVGCGLSNAQIKQVYRLGQIAIGPTKHARGFDGYVERVIAVCRPKPVDPTYEAERFDDATTARDAIRRIVDEFLASVTRWLNVPGGFWMEVNKLILLWIRAVSISTGVGKTKITIEKVADWIHSGGGAGPIIYAVPRHKLGRQIKERFDELGIDARIFRGRDAVDPAEPDNKMCLNPSAVELAMKCHADIGATCCKNKTSQCMFFDRCGYQRQMPDKDDQPDIWIAASDMLFHKQRALGKPAAVIIDEAIWSKGIRGVEPDSQGLNWEVAIDSLLNLDAGPVATNRNGARRTRLRYQLGKALQKQPVNGGVWRQLFEEANIDVEDCSQAIKLEWELFRRQQEALSLYPGMAEVKIREQASKADVIDSIQHTRRVITIWETVRQLLDDPDIAVSGRLTLKQKNGQRVVGWRGVAEINEQFQVPTLMLDATLPEASLLQVYHPHVAIVANLSVVMPPSVHIRQVLKAPTSSTKLASVKHLEATHRYILQRFMETGRQRTLIICQEKVERWLQKSALPTAIKVEHYNDITGIDDYRDVRLLILIGRTAPGPKAMETLAAALFGTQPIEAVPRANGFVWYERVKHGIRLPDGTGIQTDGDLHPDARVEMVRRQVHEAELIQALGRARAINRTADTPLDIDLLFDTCLPITVNKVVPWANPSLYFATAEQGVMLTSTVDMMKLWPSLWPNPNAAKRTLQQGVSTLPGFVPVTYQLAGAKMKQRLGYFDRTVIADPPDWLAQRLGPLVPGE